MTDTPLPEYSLKQYLADGTMREDLIRAVNTYILARAYSETMREKVSEVYADVIPRHPIYADLHRPDGRPTRTADGHQILIWDEMYLSQDDEACDRIFAEVNTKLRELGLKTPDESDSTCPAIMAERAMVMAADKLIDLSGKPFHIDSRRFLDLDKRYKWLDLVVGLTTSLPEYEPPELLKEGKPS